MKHFDAQAITATFSGLSPVQSFAEELEKVTMPAIFREISDEEMQAAEKVAQHHTPKNGWLFVDSKIGKLYLLRRLPGEACVWMLTSTKKDARLKVRACRNEAMRNAIREAAVAEWEFPEAIGRKPKEIEQMLVEMFGDKDPGTSFPDIPSAGLEVKTLQGPSIMELPKQ